MKYIDQAEVYKKSDNGLEVFKYYYPHYNYGDNRAKLKLRDEKTASAVITYYNGLWRVTDFGNQGEVNSLPAIPFVRWKENLEFVDAVNFINDVILGKRIASGKFERPQYSADYSWREVGPDDHKGEYKFVYKEKPSDEDLASIGRYITADILKEYNCKAVESYEFVGHSKKYKKDIVHVFKSTKTYPIFVFDYGKFKKLYKPYDPEKQYRFVYIGDKPKDYIYGLEQIKKADNEFIDQESDDEEALKLPEGKPNAVVYDIFRCSGESDALNLASLGCHVYWLNSESASLEYSQWEEIDQLCNKHYQVMDLDTTGHEYAMKFALKHINLYTLYLPEWLKYKSDWRGNPCKDAKDFVNISGYDLEDTARNFAQLKRRAMPMRFWTKSVNEKSGKVDYYINLEYYYHFLYANGFRVMDSKYHKKADYCYARINGKIIDLIHPNDIKKIAKRFTKEWIRSKNLMDEIALLNKINSSTQISEANLQELHEFQPEFWNHKKGLEFIHFKNASLRITEDAIEMVKHDELPNYILGKLDINDVTISHFIDRKVYHIKNPLLEIKATTAYQEMLDKKAAAKTDNERETLNVLMAQLSDLDKYELIIHDNEFIFIRFLKDLAHLYWRKELEKKQELTEEEKKEQNLLFINLLFVLGWQLAQYKDPGRPWLAFLQDMKISQVGKSSGRSGKSLYSSAIPHVRPSFYIGGRRKDITDKTDFIYDGYTRFHNNIEVDDLYEYADFNFFYTQVTGKREVNSKFISKQILNYPESGKMLISSNFELANTDSSTLARILNVGVSDYYHERTKYNDYLETRTPLNKFGKRIYDDFTEEEWNKFYNLMAYCIQLQMRFDKIQPPMTNLEKRQLRRSMTHGVSREEEFWIWANQWFVLPPDNFEEEVSPSDAGCGYFNRFIIKEVAYQAFLETLPKNMAAKYKSTQFKKSLMAFCDYYGYEFNPDRFCGNESNQEARRIVKKIDGTTKEVIFLSSNPQDKRQPGAAPNYNDEPDGSTDDDMPF